MTTSDPTHEDKPVPRPQRRDDLVELKQDIERDLRWLTETEDLPEPVRQALASRVMPSLRDAVGKLVDHRNAVAQTLGQHISALRSHAEHLDFHSERFASLEAIIDDESGGDAAEQLSQENWVLAKDVAGMLKDLSSQLHEVQPNEQGKQLCKTALERADALLARLEEIDVIGQDDEEDEDDDDDDDAGS